MQNQVEYIMPRRIQSERKDILTLVRMFNFVEDVNYRNVILNYKNTIFFAAELYGFYHFRIKQLSNKGIKVEAINVKEDVDYVNHISSKWNHNFVPNHNTAILFHDFEQDLISENYDSFDYYMQKELLSRFIQSRIIRDVVVQYLSELFVNSRTHGHTNNIICGGQIYKTSNKIKIVFVDFGVTIPYNIENYTVKGRNYYFKDNDADAIKWSTLAGNSTKSTSASGLGLNSIIGFIDSCNGRILIISRNGSYERANKIDKTFNTGIRFNGTMVTIEFDLSNLKEINKPKNRSKVFSI